MLSWTICRNGNCTNCIKRPRRRAIGPKSRLLLEMVFVASQWVIARLISVPVAAESSTHVNNPSTSTEFDPVKVAAEEAARDGK